MKDKIGKVTFYICLNNIKMWKLISYKICMILLLGCRHCKNMEKTKIENNFLFKRTDTDYMLFLAIFCVAFYIT